MAVSTLKLTRKGHTTFNRAAALRHTNIEVPCRDCLSCLQSIPGSTRVKSILPSTDHQCLFCAKCLQRVNDKVAEQSVRSAKEILNQHLTVKFGDTSEESKKVQVRDTAISEMLTELDQKLLSCGFCRKTPSRLPVRYCIQCRKYLCSHCYARHQGEVKVDRRWLHRHHATIDLNKIRNPDVL